MDITKLEIFGLTNGESKTYITLLKNGLSTVGILVNETGIARSKIYDVLNRLVHKGLVSTVTEGRIQKYNALPPTRLKEVIEKQKQEITTKEIAFQQLLPALNNISSQHEQSQAEILNGPRGIKTFFDMSLHQNNTKDEILVLGYSKEASTYFHAYFRDYHKTRTKLKIPGRVIYDYETWHLKKREKRPYCQQRYFQKGIRTPAFIMMWENTVGTIVFTPEQKVCFMLQNKTAARSYKEYFYLLWNEANRTGK